MIFFTLLPARRSIVCRLTTSCSSEDNERVPAAVEREGVALTSVADPRGFERPLHATCEELTGDPSVLPGWIDQVPLAGITE